MLKFVSYVLNHDIFEQLCTHLRLITTQHKVVRRHSFQEKHQAFVGLQLYGGNNLSHFALLNFLYFENGFLLFVFDEFFCCLAAVKLLYDDNQSQYGNNDY